MLQAGRACSARAFFHRVLNFPRGIMRALALLSAFPLSRPRVPSFAFYFFPRNERRQLRPLRNKRAMNIFQMLVVAASLLEYRTFHEITHASTRRGKFSFLTESRLTFSFFLYSAGGGKSQKYGTFFAHDG